jgi:hypothetical protein
MSFFPRKASGQSKKKKCGGCGEGSDALMDETDKRWKMEQMVLFGCR